MAAIADNLRQVWERIHAVANRLGQDPQSITLVAVSKTMPPDVIREAQAAGHLDFGENRMQEALEKIPQLPAEIRWHWIGSLQRNKAKEAVQHFALVQSVDSKRLAIEINRRAEQIEKVQDVLIQVNTSHEKQKSGCAPEETEQLAETIAEMPAVRLQGLMTIGPLTEDQELIRTSFVTLRRIFERLDGLDAFRGTMKYLSMGMTADFELALEEGANMLRIGTAIFGPRRSR